MLVDDERSSSNRTRRIETLGPIHRRRDRPYSSGAIAGGDDARAAERAAMLEALRAALEAQQAVPLNQVEEPVFIPEPDE